MGSKRKARSRSARRSRDLDSPVCRDAEEYMLVSRDHSSDVSIQSEKDKIKLTATSVNQSVSSIIRSVPTRQSLTIMLQIQVMYLLQILQALCLSHAIPYHHTV